MASPTWPKLRTAPVEIAGVLADGIVDWARPEPHAGPAETPAATTSVTMPARNARTVLLTPATPSMARTGHAPVSRRPGLASPRSKVAPVQRRSRVTDSAAQVQ